MKIVVLTTETPHHAQFVKEVSRVFPIDCVILETQVVVAPFETEHPYERERDYYEREIFFDGNCVTVSSLAETREFENLNRPEALDFLSERKPDVVIVFGTGRIRHELIATVPDSIFNLHGGDPEEYRGLDSHLWAIYHGDFGGLVTTLHRVDTTIDGGDVVAKSTLGLYRGMKLLELRRVNTQACVELVLGALNAYHATGRCVATTQARKGRYYSFMPAALKELCRAKFEKYTANLK